MTLFCKFANIVIVKRRKITMTTYYKAIITYNDGYIVWAKCASEEQAIASVKSQNDNCTRVYKHAGVDYGTQGKLLTCQELHGGVKDIVVHKWVKADMYNVDKSILN